MKARRLPVARLLLCACLALTMLSSSPPAFTEPEPTPAPPPIAFTTPGNSAVQKYMRLELGQPIDDAVEALGEPTAVYGQDSYAYRAIAGAAGAEAAAVYRFSAKSVNFECIASALDGRILKKQVSSPGAFPKLLDSASELAVEGGTPYDSLYAAAGVAPYLWMSFLPPNADSGAGRCDVCLWPDGSGQLVAVVRRGVVLRCEYQPNGVVLPAAAVDGITPRAPRYLALKPKNGNAALSKYAPFKKFAALRPGQKESDVTRKMGEAASAEDNGILRTLTYEFENDGFAAGAASFQFVFAGGDDPMLISKSAAALPLAEAEVRARYAPQMLPGMALDDIRRFMGDPLVTGQSLSTTGELLSSQSYAGDFACVSAVFAEGADACLWHEAVLDDPPEEGATLYEEYVLAQKPQPAKAQSVKPNAPSPTRRRARTTTPKPMPSLRVIPAVPFVRVTPEAPY